MSRTPVREALSRLEQEGLVGRNPESGKYGLGLGLVSLGGMALGRLDVRGIALPHLNPLVALTEETVIVTALEGRKCVNTASVRVWIIVPIKVMTVFNSCSSSFSNNPGNTVSLKSSNHPVLPPAASRNRPR